MSVRSDNGTIVRYTAIAIMNVEMSSLIVLCMSYQEARFSHTHTHFGCATWHVG